MECDYLSGWIKNGHIGKNLTENGEPQRYSWGMQKKKTDSGVQAPFVLHVSSLV